MYTNYATFLQETERLDIFLVLLSPAEPFRPEITKPFNWTLVSGSTYKCTYPLNSWENWHICFVRSSPGIPGEMTRQTSVANVNATDMSWYFDLHTERALYVRIGSGIDPNDSEMQIYPVIPLCTELPYRKPDGRVQPSVVFDIPDGIFADLTGATNTVFDPRIIPDGLNDFSWAADSAYYGPVRQSEISIEIANGMRTPFDTVGLLDDWADRFEFKNTYAQIYHGDGGTVLTFAQHKLMGAYRISKQPRVSEGSVTINFENGFFFQNYKIPRETYTTGNTGSDTPDDVLGRTIPRFWGVRSKMPGYRVEPSVWNWAFNASDSVEAVYVADVLQTSGYTVDLPTSTVTFTSDPGVDAVVTVSATRNVDADNTPGEPSQLAGAWMRSILITSGRQLTASVPVTTYDALDANFPTVVSEYLDQPTTVGALVEKFSLSMAAMIRYKNGLFEVVKYDPASIVIAATVKEDQIVSQPEKYGEGLEQWGTLAVAYYDAATNTTKYSPRDWSNVRNGARKNIDNTILTTQEDASALAGFMLSVNGFESVVVEMDATGEVFDVSNGDIISVTRTRGFDIDKTWDATQFIVREIKKRPKKPLGTVHLVLVEPETVILPNVSLSAQGDCIVTCEFVIA